MVSKEAAIACATIILVTYTLGLSVINQAYTQGQTSATFSSMGSVEILTTAGIGIYSDSQCTTTLTSLEWGTLQPGESKDITGYIKNEGSSPIVVDLATSNWNPIAAATYLTFSWNYNTGYSISPGNTIPVTFTLTVSPDITGVDSFSFDVTIVGSN